MSADPNDPKAAAKREQSNSLYWAVISAAVAAYFFWQMDKVEADKRTFYIVGGAIAALYAAWNGFAAWKLSQQSSQPPK